MQCTVNVDKLILFSVFIGKPPEKHRHTNMNFKVQRTINGY